MYDNVGNKCVRQKGYCHVDPNNSNYYILKTKDTSGWASGDECWAVKGGKTNWGGVPCMGNSNVHCKSLIDSNNNKLVKSLGCYNEPSTGRIFKTHVPGDYTIKTCNAYAKDNKHDIFGLQYGNECWVDSNTKKYNTYTPANCANNRLGYNVGTGGNRIVNIYKTV
jgi:hypothetical protein